MLTDPDFGQHNSRTPPEELLIFAVLSRAILDLFGPTTLASNQAEGRKSRYEALRFLTDHSGAWAKRRTELCDAIGFNGDDVRSRVVRVLEGDTRALDVYEGRGSLNHVTEARELWEREKQARADAQTRRKVKPKRQGVRYMEARPKVMALLERPRTVKELSDETGFSDGVVRTVLNKAIEKGTVEKQGAAYRVPDTPVAATAA
ncbi:hypothetical protein [Phaeobacter inhibens]|uniref:hypothetical protein n=1 Tax=Phaeobacter inhibens TaxID=221822 RepID=UPI00076BBE88|nr:hypothetical protein [Phaeobacter inhibens]KXF91299.1 hypothetical protein AT574_07535 [Phaeobacter inhibens]WHP69385.1 hypothetical protein QMZ01_04145 [Phaeobacter inhibens]